MRKLRTVVVCLLKTCLLKNLWTELATGSSSVRANTTLAEVENAPYWWLAGQKSKDLNIEAEVELEHVKQLLRRDRTFHKHHAKCCVNATLAEKMATEALSSHFKRTTSEMSSFSRTNYFLSWRFGPGFHRFCLCSNRELIKVAGLTTLHI